MKHFRLKLGLGRSMMAALLLTLMLVPAVAQAQTTDPSQVFSNYYQAFKTGNLEGMMAQYADNAVFKYLPAAPFPGPATYNGLTEIRQVEKGAIDANLKPNCATPIVQGTNVSVDCTATLASLPFAFKETFNIQNGKIVSNTVEYTPDTYAKLKALAASQSQGGAPGAPNTGSGGVTNSPTLPTNLVWLVAVSGVVVLTALALLVVARRRKMR